MDLLRKILPMALAAFFVTAFQVLAAAAEAGTASAGPGNTAPGAPSGRAGRDFTPDHPRSLAPYFTPATSSPKTPDKDGFLQRWLLLEPINKPNRGNTVFTDSYVWSAFNTDYFPDQFTVIPRNGDKVKVGDQELAWHALDSANWN